MSIEEDVKALREALALGPKEWTYDSNETSFAFDPQGNSLGGEPDGTYMLFEAEFSSPDFDVPVLTERCSEADAKFIGACTPGRISRLLAELEVRGKDAERYRLLRRGQRWSVIDGIGDALRAAQLDSAIDTALSKGAQEGVKA